MREKKRIPWLDTAKSSEIAKVGNGAGRWTLSREGRRSDAAPGAAFATHFVHTPVASLILALAPRIREPGFMSRWNGAGAGARSEGDGVTLWAVSPQVAALQDGPRKLKRFRHWRRSGASPPHGAVARAIANYPERFGPRSRLP